MIIRISIKTILGTVLLAAISATGCNGKDNYASPAPKPSKTDSVSLPPIVVDTSWPAAGANAVTAFQDFNKSFLMASGQYIFYKTALNNTEKDYFWEQALDIQMVEDYYRVHRAADVKTLIDSLLQTFLSQNHGSGGLADWSWNNYNDDLLWAGLAFVRGYEIVGKPAYLYQAKYAFDFLYGRGWDNQLGGGIWWDAGHTAKSGLSNNPAVILSCYLYRFTGDSAYLAKAKAIYNWIWNTLYDHQSGAVCENISAAGILAKDANVYNIGAFVGGANFLHDLTGTQSYTDDAKRSIDYVVSHNTIMHRSGGNTWQSEFARALGEFLRSNPSYWNTYYTWMKANAAAAWQCRRTDLDLMWNDWTAPTRTDEMLTANECVSAIVMLAVTPDRQPE